MRYQVLVLDLDGTLTNSKKEITDPTKRALIEIQQAGKIVVLASGRPINGVAPLAEELELENNYVQKVTALLREEPDKTDEQVAEMAIYGKEEK